MRAYHELPAETGHQRVEVVFRYESRTERAVRNIGRLIVEIVVWFYCGWSGTPYPDSLKH